MHEPNDPLLRAVSVSVPAPCWGDRAAFAAPEGPPLLRLPPLLSKGRQRERRARLADHASTEKGGERRADPNEKGGEPLLPTWDNGFLTSSLAQAPGSAQSSREQCAGHTACLGEGGPCRPPGSEPVMWRQAWLAQSSSC